jgi:hypothetical protein
MVVDWSYLAVLNREVYDADMKDLCTSLVEGLRFVKRQQDRGIGGDTRSGSGPEVRQERVGRDVPGIEKRRSKSVSLR